MYPLTDGSTLWLTTRRCLHFKHCCRKGLEGTTLIKQTVLMRLFWISTSGSEHPSLYTFSRVGKKTVTSSVCVWAGLGHAAQKAAGAEGKQSCSSLQGQLAAARWNLYQPCILLWLPAPHSGRTVCHFIQIQSVFFCPSYISYIFRVFSN